MNFVQCFYSFKLNQNISFHKQINYKFTNHNTIIMDLDTVLLYNLQTRFPQFMSQCIFIDLFQKSISQRVTHRIGTPNNPFSYLV